MVISVSLGAQSYPILLEAGALARAGQHLSLARRVLVVTDSGVPQEYARTVAGACRQARICTLPAGENSKNMDNYQRLLREMLALSMDRGDCVAAVGGDVVMLEEDGTLRVNGTLHAGEVLYPTYPAGGVTYPYTVPEGCLFILNDYRTRGRDSRHFGAVPQQDAAGKVITLLRRRGL